MYLHYGFVSELISQIAGRGIQREKMWWEKKIVEQNSGEKWVRERNQRSCGAGIERHLAGKKWPTLLA